MGLLAAGASSLRPDLVVIDLDYPSLAGCEVETLAEALVYGADNGVVLGTYVGGSYRSAASVERGV